MRFIIFIRPPPFIFFIMSLHLLELVQQAVDVLHLNPGAGGDAALAGGLQQLGLAALERGHRADDAFHAAHVAFGAVHVRPGSILPAPCRRSAALGSLSIRPDSPPMFFICEICDQEVVQVEAVARS